MMMMVLLTDEMVMSLGIKSSETGTIFLSSTITFHHCSVLRRWVPKSGLRMGGSEDGLWVGGSEDGLWVRGSENGLEVGEDDEDW